MIDSCLTVAFGNAFLYSGSCTSVAYLSPYPPLKITTSSGASSLTPSGFVALLVPPELLPLLSLPPLVAHALRRL